eukprot:1767254-Prymnesium_polylepis.1
MQQRRPSRSSSRAPRSQPWRACPCGRTRSWRMAGRQHQSPAPQQPPSGAGALGRGAGASSRA